MQRTLDSKGNPVAYCHATGAYGAAKFTFPFVTSIYLHHICNGDDNCQTYGSHKYVSAKHHAKCLELTGRTEDHGIYGSWLFKDGSILFALCDEMYMAFRPEQQGLKEQYWVFDKTEGA